MTGLARGVLVAMVIVGAYLVGLGFFLIDTTETVIKEISLAEVYTLENVYEVEVIEEDYENFMFTVKYETKTSETEGMVSLIAGTLMLAVGIAYLSDQIMWKKEEQDE